jgi:V-type H+-transporting ATPase subunit d
MAAWCVISLQYRQLCQCETLEDVKLCLGDTDYMNVLQNQSKLTPEIILKKCEDKFVHEFQFLQSQAVGPLATFLYFITYEDLISNISFIITSMIKGSDPAQLLNKCLPLGRSPHLKSVMTFENVDNSDGLVELYRTVLIDTPVASYFETYFNSEVKSDQPSREIQRVYNEIEIDIITNMLQKLWLEDFYKFCTQSIGGDTGEIMKELLEFEADRRAIE